MNEQIIKLTEQLLYEEETPFVAARKLYDLIKEEKEGWQDSYEDFLLALKGEESLFSFLEIPLGDDIFLDDEQRGYLDEQDYLSGPFIGLTARGFEEEVYSAFLLERVNGIIHSVEHLYASKEATQDFGVDEKEEMESILARAYEIQKKLEMYKSL